MRNRTVVFAAIVAVGLLIMAPVSFADIVKFKDGTEKEGVIKKVETGRVFIMVGTEMAEYDILTIDSMDFDTPHILTSTDNVPMEHFLKNIEAQEVVRNFRELEKTEADVRSMLTDIRAYWSRVQPIASSEVKSWEMEKEQFRKPLSKYQEMLNDLYFHVLARVDAYNSIASEASSVYVGVKGIRTGSSLVPKDLRKLPLTKYVPDAWYDTIYFDGYNRGYEDAYQKANPATNSRN